MKASSALKLDDIDGENAQGRWLEPLEPVWGKGARKGRRRRGRVAAAAAAAGNGELARQDWRFYQERLRCQKYALSTRPS